jgi:hypothetical protein
MTCPPTYELVSVILTRCWKVCDTGYTNAGEDCRRTSSSLPASEMLCDTDAGYTIHPPTARCRAACVTGYITTGETCFRPETLGVEFMTCSAGEKRQDGRCYPQTCKAGYFGQLTRIDGDNGDRFIICWQRCSSAGRPFDCAAACTDTEDTCALGVVDQVLATLIVAANLATMGVGGTVAGTAVDAVKLGTNFVKASSPLARSMIKAADALQTISEGTVTLSKAVALAARADGDTVTTIFQRFLKPDVGDVVRWSVKGYGISTKGKDFYEDAEAALVDYHNRFEEEFASQTTAAVNEKINQWFAPATARFFKRAWSEVSMAEMVETNAWGAMDIVLTTVGAVADPTGVFGLISAYAKPICGAVPPALCPGLPFCK